MSSSFAEDLGEPLGFAPEIAEAAAAIRKTWDARTRASRYWFKEVPYTVPVSTITPIEPEDRTYKDLY